MRFTSIIGVVGWGLDFMLLDFPAHLAGKLVVDGMAWPGGNDATLDGTANEGHVADDVEQLVACTLVLPYQGLVLNVAQLCGITMLHVQHVGQLVELFLRNLALVHDDGVVQVAAFDEIGLEQRLNIAHEDKGTCGRNLCGVVIDVVERGKLRVDELRVERAHRGEREVVVGQDRDARAAFLVLYFNLLAYDIPVLGRVQFLNAYLLDFLHVLDGRAVEDGELRAVHLNQAVVHAQCVEG